MSRTEQDRIRYLPGQLLAARKKVEMLVNEAARYHMWDLLTKAELVSRVGDNEAARLLIDRYGADSPGQAAELEYQTGKRS